MDGAAHGKWRQSPMTEKPTMVRVTPQRPMARGPMMSNIRPTNKLETAARPRPVVI